MGNRILTLLLITWVFVISTQAFSRNKRIQLRYACKPNGDISAINLDTNYKFVYAYDTMISTCEVQVLKNASVIKITGCSGTSRKTPIKLILSIKAFRTPLLIGGKDHKMAILRCTHRGLAVSKLVDMSINAKGLFRKMNGFPEGFAQRDNDVSVEMYDVTGEPGYRIFTIAYPVGVTITGPPESDIFPEVCRAYSSEKVGTGLQATLLRDGCSLSHGLMFNFSKEEEDWFDRNITAVDLDRFILDTNLHHDETMDEEEDVEPLPPPPMLHTHVYAFKFYLSGSISIECEVRVCPVGSIDCYSSCDPAQMTTTVAPITATVTKPITATVTEPLSTESVPQPEPQEISKRKKREIDNTKFVLYNTEKTNIPIGKDFIIRDNNAEEPKFFSELYDDGAKLHDKNLQLAPTAEKVKEATLPLKSEILPASKMDIVTEAPHQANEIIIKGNKFWEIIVKAKLQVRKPTPELTTAVAGAEDSLTSPPQSQTSLLADKTQSKE